MKKELDTRNVLDKFKGWEQDLIREDVKKNAFPYSICMVNLNYDYNFATVLRNANAFGVENVYYVSESKRYDKRGTVGTHHYTPPIHLASLAVLMDISSSFNCVAVELDEKAVPISHFEYPDNPLLIFGSEGLGLSKEILDICPNKVYIPMYGSVRSLNTACASAVVMNDFTEKWRRQRERKTTGGAGVGISCGLSV